MKKKREEEEKKRKEDEERRREEEKKKYEEEKRGLVKAQSEDNINKIRGIFHIILLSFRFLFSRIFPPARDLDDKWHAVERQNELLRQQNEAQLKEIERFVGEKEKWKIEGETAGDVKDKILQEMEEKLRNLEAEKMAIERNSQLEREELIKRLQEADSRIQKSEEDRVNSLNALQAEATQYSI